MTDRLGRLEKIDLRQIWQSESSHFTPWLAREENLSILADTLRIDLQLEAQEQNVGPFRADLLCKETTGDTWVLIENQLERTDHTHLGQLMTYAAGLQAVTIVWIAAQFTEEHRAALDWLNDITDDSFRFFGLEVELWRIGDSPAAPKFNIVSKPNSWTRAVHRSARSIDEGDLSPTRQMQFRYWTALAEVVGAQSGRPRAAAPQPQSWVTHSIGRTNFALNAAMHTRDRWIRAELYLAGKSAKAQFDALAESKREIDDEFCATSDERLEWERLDDGQDCRIAVYLRNTDPLDEGDWARQHKWLARMLSELYEVFHNRVKALGDARSTTSDEGFA